MGQLERKLYRANRPRLAGVDEVGRGCIAGPVVAAAVSLNYDKLFALGRAKLSLIRDSKKLTREKRQTIQPTIKSIAQHWAIGEASVAEIETIGILPATFLAMRRALASFDELDLILVDGKLKIPDLAIPQEPIIAGDAQVFAIAAASIIAKEFRDDYMRSQASVHAHWGFETHVGYGTLFHKAAIDRHGICPLHRRNFAPITNLIGTGAQARG